MLIDMLLRIEPEARVFTLDTGVLFPETYESGARSRSATGSERRGHGRDAQAAHTATSCGSAANCCGIAQGGARSRRRCAEWTPGSPACGASSRPRARGPEARLGRESTSSGSSTRWRTGPRRTSGATSPSTTPYNPLHDRGYASIGCTPCTQPGTGREGRWAGPGQDRVRAAR